MGKILVLGDNSRALLACVRSYGKAGHRVYLADCKKNNVLKSKYIHEHIILPDFDKNPDEWCKEIQRLIFNEQFDFIIPTNDGNTIKFSYFRKKYGSPRGLYLPDDCVKSITDDKEKSTELAKKLGVPVADTMMISNKKNMEYIVGEWGFPIVVKPHFSFTESSTRKKDVVLVLNNQEDYYRQKDDIKLYLSKYGSVIVQKYFGGRGVGIELLAKDGEILTAFQHIRIHEPKNGGGSSSRKSVAIDERLYNDARKIVKELNYTGVLMVEFKYNTDNNTYIFIELNARFWGSLPLSISAGIDFPIYYYQMCVENKIDFNKNYRANLYQHNYESDLGWKVEQIKNRNYVLFASETILQIVRFIIGKEKIDELDIHDCAVFGKTITSVWGGFFNSFYNKIQKKILCKTATCPAEKVDGNNKVLFVCYGNICRSAFADLYRKQLTNNTSNTDSAGYYHTPGREMDTRISMLSRGVLNSTDCFRSKIIDIKQVQWADYIFCFDISNYMYLKKNYRAYLNKVYFLGSYDKENGIFIEDPYDKNEKEREEIIKRIARIIENNLV